MIVFLPSAINKSLNEFPEKFELFVLNIGIGLFSLNYCYGINKTDGRENVYIDFTIPRVLWPTNG